MVFLKPININHNKQIYACNIFLSFLINICCIDSLIYLFLCIIDLQDGKLSKGPSVNNFHLF